MRYPKTPAKKEKKRPPDCQPPEEDPQVELYEQLKTARAALFHVVENGTTLQFACRMVDHLIPELERCFDYFYYIAQNNWEWEAIASGKAPDIDERLARHKEHWGFALQLQKELPDLIEQVKRLHWEIRRDEREAC